MKKTSYFAVLALFIFSSTCTALDQFSGLSLPVDPVIQSMVDSVSVDSLEAYVRRLEGFYTRRVLTDSNRAAAQWIEQKYSAWGYQVEIDSFWVDSLYYSAYYNQTTNIHQSGYGRNVVASKKGSGDSLINYLIGGHFDSFNAMSVPNSFDDPYAPAPGAEDDASGTACLLETARVLRAMDPECSIKMAGFGNEEIAYSGAQHYAMNAYLQNQDIAGMFSYDCVGFDAVNPNTMVCGYWDAKGMDLKNVFSTVAGLYAPALVVRGDTLVDGGDSNWTVDAWPFYRHGYPTAFNYDDDGLYYSTNNIAHSTADTAGLLDFSYCRLIVMNTVATLAVLSDYPGIVRPLTVDAGDGQSLVVSWTANEKHDIAYYRVYYGHVPGIFDSTTNVGLCDTIGGLMADSLYHITVRAIDIEGHPSPVAYDFTVTPRLAPLAPVGLAATPLDSGISLAWKKNTELDITGYNVYRRIDGGGFDSLTHTVDTFLLNKPLSGASKYYYKIQAKDNDGNKSPLSDSVYCRPITLDQGILAVDETNNWTAGLFPRDAQQDSFYNYILTGYKCEPYEYGSSLQKPTLADFGPYSTVAWFADDYVTLLASGAVNDMKSYLGKGGKLWFTGWKPTGDIRNTATYPDSFAAGNILYDCFKISYANLSGNTDSFKLAAGLNGYPDIAVDTLKYPSTIWGKVFRNIEALTPLAGADSIYVMDMKNNGSAYEGKACAVRDSGKTVFFGFPIYFMDKEQAKLSAQKVMAEFGEPYTGVESQPDNRERMTDVRLLQNAPNPFAQLTIISYQLAKPGLVSLKVYNVAGQLVKTLVNGIQPQGNYNVKWDGRDDNGLKVSNGVYVYRLEVGGIKGTRKMILLR